MQSNEKAPGAYVRKMAEQSMACARQLLDENSRLLGMLSTMEEETSLLIRHLSAMRRVFDENEELRHQTLMADMERERLEQNLSAVHAEMAACQKQVTEMRNRIQKLDADSVRSNEQFSALEKQNTALTNLYVAAYRLNGTARTQEVISALQEIVANLIGSEEMAIFEVDPSGANLSLLGSLGIDPEIYRTIPIGKGLIGRTALNGERYIADGRAVLDRQPTERHLTASIPLKLDENVIGVLAVFRLLPQKKGLQSLDLELFDLLSCQAATSLYCTTAFRHIRRFSTESPPAGGRRVPA